MGHNLTTGPPGKGEQAMDRAQFRKAALAALASVAAWAGPARWIEVRTPHFTVVSNASEDQARDAARAFEEIRAVFASAFRGLRVDSGRPMMLIAVKDDASLKELLPDYAAAKDRAQLAGYYLSTQDTDYALVNVDAYSRSEISLHAVFHEYTHAVIRMNFGPVPTWLDEGFAEYYGNTVIKKDEVDVGMVTSDQLYILRGGLSLPLEALLRVDHASPLYTERNRASAFYAESWELIHYLLSDPEAVQGRLLQKYLQAMDQGADPVAAAQAAFGDLKDFESRLRAYAQRQAFRFARGKPLAQLGPADFVVRALPPAEATACRADFLARSGHAREAAPLVTSALAQDPNLAAAHATAGFLHAQAAEPAEAQKELEAAERLGSRDFRVQYQLAKLDRTDGSRRTAMFARLERTLALNPDFAPALIDLAYAYAENPMTQEKALEPALKAVKLEPGDFSHLANLTQLCLLVGRIPEARQASERLVKSARTPGERAIASSIASEVESKAGRSSGR
jgi:hypothetical protein